MSSTHSTSGIMYIFPLSVVLQGLLSDDQVATAPILILGNKIDIPGACSEDELRTLFSLHGRTTGKVCIHVYMYI